MAEFPKELVGRPLPLVSLVGLDVVRNAVHRMIWHSFTVDRRADRAPINFKNFPGDHEYPKPNPKKQTYDQYVPAGIMKRKWFEKHLSRVPAVVVIFFDLDWDDALWKERQIECASRVEVVRATLQERNTRVALVLIQTKVLNPSGDDLVARDRAALLCHACKLPSNALFVLPHTDRLMGYIQRLEHEFNELAQRYYQGEAAVIRSRKDFLNKQTQLALFVRHQFKIAFLSEIRQDFTSALNHYNQAYRDLSEATANDSTLLEIKLIAGFLNYKICHCYFRTGQPRDAITQFQRHINFYKDLRGYRLLEFEHFAWLSKQFGIFGDLFHRVVDKGLEAIQIEHPGFYYQQAANYVSLRRNSCQKLCSSSAHVKSCREVEPKETEYFGMRPWRVGLKENEPASEEEQSEGFFVLQAKELLTDYCTLRVNLLSNAINHFRRHRSSRMRQWLFVQMGNEYFTAKEYSKALTLLQKVAGDQRKERWWKLLTPILRTSLKCAYLTADWQQYVALVLELAGKQSVGLSQDEKTRVLMNLTRLISNDPPEPEPDCSPAEVDKAQAIWKAKDVESFGDDRESGRRFVIIAMRGLAAFVQCKAGFETSSFSADSTVRLAVYLRSTAVFPVRFSKLSVFFTNEAYNQHCVVTDGTLSSSSGSPEKEKRPDANADLYLVPGKITSIRLHFAALPTDVGKQIKISSVTLEMGSISTGRCAVLSWEGGGRDSSFDGVSSANSEDFNGVWSNIDVYSNAAINARTPRVSLELLHSPPAIHGENYPLEAVAKFDEIAEITDVKLLLGLKENANEMNSTHYVYLDEPDFDFSARRKYVSVELGTLEKNSTIDRKLVFHGDMTGIKTIAARIMYNVQVSVDETIGGSVICSCMKEITSPVEIIAPFDISLAMATLKFETINKVNAGEPFVLLTDVRCTSPWPITIETTNYDLSPPVKKSDDTDKSQLAGLTMKKNDVISECQCLLVPSSENRAAPLGMYSLTWRRSSSQDGNESRVTTTLALPTAIIESVPFSIETEMPAYGLQRSSARLSYTIRNRTHRVQEFVATLDPSESFVFSGHKQVSFRILPDGDYCLTYSLFPLAPGNLQLPRLHLNLPRHPMAGNCERLVQRLIPTHLFVKPSGTAVKDVIPMYC